MAPRHPRSKGGMEMLIYSDLNLQLLLLVHVFVATRLPEQAAAYKMHRLLDEKQKFEGPLNVARLLKFAWLQTAHWLPSTPTGRRKENTLLHGLSSCRAPQAPGAGHPASTAVGLTGRRAFALAVCWAPTGTAAVRSFRLRYSATHQLMQRHADSSRPVASRITRIVSFA